MILQEHIQTLLPGLVEAGTVKAVRHSTEPYTLYNYTPKTQYERRWCDTSKACRGLIVHDDGRIIARPFPKFFNAEEHSPDELLISKSFSVTEKADGSLGILYPVSDGWAIATRGSFTSEQALRATQMLHTRYSEFEPLPGCTYLFEIIYPGNRIVVDYGEREELLLLAVIDIATGRDCELPSGWAGPVIRRFDVTCIPSEVLRQAGLPGDGSAEGVVLCFDWPESGPQFRVKVKIEEYKRLHRILTMTSSKTIWEALANGDDLSALADRVPDEFHDWLRAEVSKLNTGYDRIANQAHADFANVSGRVGTHNRRDFAEEAKKLETCALLFKLLDGNPINEAIWKQLKPEYSRPFRVQSEDTN